MSDRRRPYQDNSSSSSLDAVIIERRPKKRSPSPTRRRRVSFSLNPFKRRRSTVIIKESTIHRRRPERRSKTPSPSPSPPRGPSHIMDPRNGEEYVPLPKKLPTKEEKYSSSDDGSDKKRKVHRKVKIVQEIHPEDAREYPIVESPPPRRSPPSRESPRRRDSGIYSMETSPQGIYYDNYGRPTYAPNQSTGAEQHVRSLSKQLQELEIQNTELKKEAIRSREEAVDAKEELQTEKRRSQIEKREREVSDKEKQYREAKRISDVPAPQSRRDVVVIQPKPPVRFDPATEAHNRAKEDFKRKRGGYQA